MVLLALILTVGLAVQTEPGNRQVAVGWADEMNTVRNWHPLGVGRAVKVGSPIRGAMRMDLDRVPADWPFEYQWGGMTRRATVDVARFPMLSAYVSQLLGGYAHMDVDVLDAEGKPVKSIRSSGLQAGGVTFVNLRESLDPAVYTLQIRLIVGGSNQGCWGTYNWVRCTSVEDGERLRRNPDLPVSKRRQSAAL